ncbi:response regulator transcription factor [Gottfriedia luciferensis]|uniref:response regulator transcription factor n=1 Tax=Gottfriedia luciferensis TaxID=178774 RepID=UPI000B430338|nr:response regulator transcription factor [Gottfriedia luciferensis]
MVRVLLVDDHIVVRTGLEVLLNGKSGISIVGVAADGDEAINLAKELTPDIVLMDLSMPNGKDGITATKIIKEYMPDTKILILTMHDSDEYLFRAIQAGASGYILKSSPHEELLNAIHLIHKGNAYLTPSATKRLMNEYLIKMQQEGLQSSYEILSEREKEVLVWIARGYSNKEIAEQLVISVKTVETHKSNLMEKIGLRTRPDLVKYAFQKGLLDFE